MSKMSELSMLLGDLIDCGQKLTETARALREFYTDTGGEQTTGTEKLKESDQKPVEAVKEKKPDTEKEPEKTYTKEEIRALLSAKAGAEDGRFKSEVKAIVRKYGHGGSLTNIDAKDYPALVKEIERIGSAG